MVLRDDKIIPITKLYSTVFIYVLYEYSKRVVQSVGRQSVDGRYWRRRLMLELYGRASVRRTDCSRADCLSLARLLTSMLMAGAGARWLDVAHGNQVLLIGWRRRRRLMH